MKEYVQSSRMDQCSLTATSEEQYVNIEIPNNWLEVGNTKDTLIFTIEQLDWYYPYMAEKDEPLTRKRGKAIVR